MKNLPVTATLLFASVSLFGQVTVLTTGESWQGYDVFDFESDGSGAGLTAMTNTGTNGGTWNLNSQGGKFVTDGAGDAVTDGAAGTWARSISYASPITSGKWRLEFDFSSYDFTTFDNMTGINDLTLELRDGTTSVVKLQFRIHDDVDADGVADQTQVGISHLSDGTKTSFFSGKNSTMVAAADAVWKFAAVEFDFVTGTMFVERNNVIIGGTGEANDTGSITFSQFTELRLSANGNWASSTADTGVFNTEAIALYTAVPEPSTYAFVTGLCAIGLFLIRRRRK